MGEAGGPYTKGSYRSRLGEPCLQVSDESDVCPRPQPQDDYSVLFEDTSYADGYSPPLNVAQRYVVACKEPKKK